MHVFYKHAKLNPFLLVTLHCFLHSLRCSRAVSYLELLFCMGDIVSYEAGIEDSLHDCARKYV